MKKVYDKPLAQKVEFSYDNQVVVASNGYQGNVGNKENTGVCQQQSNTCNYFWHVPVAGASLFSLEDCKSEPIDE